MKKAIIIDAKRFPDNKKRRIMEAVSNALLGMKFLVKVVDYVHLYPMDDNKNIYYAGDVVLLEGSSFAIAFLSRLWGNTKFEKPFDEVCTDYANNKLIFRSDG